MPATILTAELDANVPIAEEYPDGLKATAYFEDYLFKLFQAINEINVLAGVSYGVVNGDSGSATALIPSDTLSILGGTGISTVAADGAPDSVVITNTDPFPEAPVDGVTYGRKDTGWIDLNSVGIDHGSLAGLADDDHPQYFLADGSRELTGNVSFASSVTAPTITSLNHGGAFTIAAEDAGGTLRSLLEGDPDHSTDLMFAGAKVLETTAQGFRFGTTNLALLELDLGATPDRVNLRNLTVSGHLLFQGQNSGNVQTNLFEGDPDGQAQLHYAGTKAFSTNASGIDVQDTSGVVPIITFRNDASTGLGQILIDGTGNTAVRSQVHGGTLRLQGEDAGGTLRQLVVCDPDNTVELYYAGTLEATTKSGGFRIDDELEVDGAFNHDGATFGIYATTPVAQSSAYTPTNVSADRSYDADATSVDELADVLGTLIADLQLTGIIG
jgi:hypothetical protein